MKHFNASKTSGPANIARNSAVLRRGSKKIVIYYEPDGNRRGWRLIWYQEGRGQIEMHDSLDDAISAGAAKLSELSSGEQVLTQEEVEQLFDFKRRLQNLERQCEIRRAVRELLRKIQSPRNSFVVYRLAADPEIGDVAGGGGIVLKGDIKYFSALFEESDARAYWRLKIYPKGRGL